MRAVDTHWRVLGPAPDTRDRGAPLNRARSWRWGQGLGCIPYWVGGRTAPCPRALTGRPDTSASSEIHMQLPDGSKTRTGGFTPLSDIVTEVAEQLRTSWRPPANDEDPACRGASREGIQSGAGTSLEAIDAQ